MRIRRAAVPLGLREAFAIGSFGRFTGRLQEHGQSIRGQERLRRINGGILSPEQLGARSNPIERVEDRKLASSDAEFPTRKLRKPCKASTGSSNLPGASNP